MINTKSFRYLVMLFAITSVFSMLAIACGADEDPAPSGVSAEELRQIVSEEVAKAQPAPQPQVSMQEIGALVETAMAGMTAEMAEGSISADDIQSMVQSAVASAAAQGASPEEIQAMVQGAVAGCNRKCRNRRKTCKSAITRAVSEAQAGMITSADVDKAVSSAVMQAAEAGTLITP